VPSDEDLAFAKAAVERKLCTQEQVNECLIAQSYEDDPKPSLEEIMVFRGLLTAEQQRQVREALKPAAPPAETEPARPPAAAPTRTDEQKQKMQALLMKLTSAASPKPESPAPAAPVAAKAEKAAPRPPATAPAKPSPVKAASRPSAPPAPPPAPKGPSVRATCAICGTAFEGVVDRGGRVRCPECHSSFTPK
jgi:hypothetical protein